MPYKHIHGPSASRMGRSRILSRETGFSPVSDISVLPVLQILLWPECPGKIEAGWHPGRASSRRIAILVSAFNRRFSALHYRNAHSLYM